MHSCQEMQPLHEPGLSVVGLVTGLSFSANISQVQARWYAIFPLVFCCKGKCKIALEKDIPICHSLHNTGNVTYLFPLKCLSSSNVPPFSVTPYSVRFSLFQIYIDGLCKTEIAN